MSNAKVLFEHLSDKGAIFVRRIASRSALSQLISIARYNKASIFLNLVSTLFVIVSLCVFAYRNAQNPVIIYKTDGTEVKEEITGFQREILINQVKQSEIKRMTNDSDMKEGSPDVKEPN